MKKKLTLVLAGNYKEFLYWCRQNDINPKSPIVDNVIYISSPNSVHGLIDFNLIKWGNWEKHTEQFIEELEFRSKTRSKYSILRPKRTERVCYW